MREELDLEQKYTSEGQAQKMPKRQLAARIMINKGLEKQDPKLLENINSHARRLFPEREEAEFLVESGLNDEFILRAFFDSMAMGEPHTEAGNPLEHAMMNQTAVSQNRDGDAWNEGDWEAIAEEEEDDDDD